MVDNEVKQYNNILSKMSSEDWRELLKLDIYADSSNELNPDSILKIMEVLEQREENILENQCPDIEAALDSFKENYLPYIDDAESLYEWDNQNNNEQNHKPHEPYPSKKVNNSPKIVKLKRLGFVAALFVVFFTIFLNTTALGGIIQHSVAQWSHDIFRFSERVASIQVSSELTSLHEALIEQGITEMLAPTWIPDGYKLIELDVMELPEKVIFAAVFEYDGKIFIIQIINHIDHTDMAYEKSDGDVYIYPQNGINHYIMSNIDLTNVVWSNQNYECFFSGNIVIGDAKLIINSIYER